MTFPRFFSKYADLVYTVNFFNFRKTYVIVSITQKWIKHMYFSFFFSSVGLL